MIGSDDDDNDAAAAAELETSSVDLLSSSWFSLPICGCIVGSPNWIIVLCVVDGALVVVVVVVVEVVEVFEVASVSCFCSWASSFAISCTCSSCKWATISSIKDLSALLSTSRSSFVEVVVIEVAVEVLELLVVSLLILDFRIESISLSMLAGHSRAAQAEKSLYDCESVARAEQNSVR